MLVKELIATLETMPQDAEIVMGIYLSNYQINKSKFDYPLEIVKQIDKDLVRFSSFPCVR